MICFGQIRQTNKSLTCCIYKNGNITKIYFCFPCSNEGVLVIMRTITSNIPGDSSKNYVVCRNTAQAVKLKVHVLQLLNV